MKTSKAALVRALNGQQVVRIAEDMPTLEDWPATKAKLETLGFVEENNGTMRHANGQFAMKPKISKVQDGLLKASSSNYNFSYSDENGVHTSKGEVKSLYVVDDNTLAIDCLSSGRILYRLKTNADFSAAS